jgi:hypothetical protein
MTSNPLIWCWAKLFVVCSLAGLLTGCVSSERIKDIDKVYFDLESFLQEQMDTLARSQHTITKSIQFNQENEQQQFTTGSTPEGAFPIATLHSYTRWQKELKPFLDAGINQPALLDQYTGDTVRFASGAIDSIRYQANSQDLRTRKMVINLTKEEKVEKVAIKLVNNNPLYRSEQDLTFQPEKGYTIQGQQNVYFFDKDKFRIVVRW